MAWVTLRCPRCGAYVAAPATRSAFPSWATCPHCYATLPVVPPRDPPPLFSWEVYPSVYPALPVPRAPGRRLFTLVAFTLVACTVLLAGVGGVLAFWGANALAPGTFSLSGRVLADPSDGASPYPLAGAYVNLTDEHGSVQHRITNFSGAFSFAGIPAGSALVNVSAPGWAPFVVEVFLSASYVATMQGPGIIATLQPTSVSNGTTLAESPFADLESFLASLWSATVLLGIAAVIAAFGAAAALRGRRPALGAAGGAAAMVAPAALFLLGDASAFPLLAFPTAALSALGALALCLSALPMAWVGKPPEPTE